MRLSQLFTSKLQFLVDKKDHFVQEYNINADPIMLDKIDAFNKHMNEYLALNPPKDNAKDDKKPL